MTNSPVTLLYYDSDCPLCSREAAWLKRHDKQGRIQLRDITSISDAEVPAGCSREDLMRVLHARLPDGAIVTRLAAARAVYDAIGRGWMMRWTGWPLLRPLMEVLYTFFARHRIRIGSFLGSAKCANGTCSTGRTV